MTAARHYVSRVLITAGLGVLLSTQLMHAQQQPFVPNVEAQFNALSFRPDPLGFDIANSPDPTTCKHYEGIARLQGADGTPYFVLTKSGLYTPPCFLTDDEPGTLTVVRMGSREKNGERLRSNRLQKGKDLADTFSDPDCVGDAYPECLTDLAVTHYRFNGNGGWPIYGHPEGMQTLGNILVVGVDTPLEADWDRDTNAPPMRVLFMDASDPENLTIINEFVPAYAPINNREINGGIVAITPQANGRYLMMLTGAGRSAFPFTVYNEKIWFYESNSTTADPNGPTDLRAATLSWRQLDIWEANNCTPIIDPNGGEGSFTCPPVRSPDEEYAGQNWPVNKGREHQMFNFIRQGNINGTLYVAGARGGIDLVLGARIGDDILDLYRVDFIGDQIKLKLISNTPKDSHPNAQSTFLTAGESNFAAASGFYVSPSQELIFYATEHQNTGPAGIVTMGEWRHHNMVRPGSPTYLPGVTIFPPAGGFVVNEGDSTVLAGLGEQPATKAWTQLFSDDTYSGRYVVVDFLDWGKDNFDNFKDLDGSVVDLHFGFSDEASSARWFAPSGTRIRANNHDFGDGDFPGDTRIFAGSGAPGNDPDLGSMEDVITSVQFMDEVASYYTGRPDLSWDANLDGSFETTGIIATFSAAERDGPGDVNVPVRAVHAIDGLTGYANAAVHIVNVAPTITEFGIFNNLNQQLGTTVPFFIEGLPVTVRGAFTDPGKPDHQTSVITWGDGVSTVSAAFDSFSDAFGGVKGQLSDTRTYAGAGNFNLTVNVTDDDLATVAQSMIVPVLTQEQALVQMIETLDEIIAGTTDPALKKILLDARKALQWTGESGAIDKLRLKNPQAALVKLGQSLESLQAAQAAGSDVGTLIALIEQVMASLN